MLGLLASKYGHGMIRWYVCISINSRKFAFRYDSYDNDAEYAVVLKGLEHSQALFGLENGVESAHSFRLAIQTLL